MNGGRHYLLTHFSHPKFPAYFRRAISGHGSKAGTSFYSASGVSVAMVMAQLQSELNKFHADYGLNETPCNTRLY